MQNKGLHLGDRYKKKEKETFFKDEKDPRQIWKRGNQRQYRKLQEYHKILKITVIKKPLDEGQNKYNQETWKIKNRKRVRVENMIFERPFIGILLHKQSF